MGVGDRWLSPGAEWTARGQRRPGQEAGPRWSSFLAVSWIQKIAEILAPTDVANSLQLQKRALNRARCWSSTSSAFGGCLPGFSTFLTHLIIAADLPAPLDLTMNPSRAMSS